MTSRAIKRNQVNQKMVILFDDRFDEAFVTAALMYCRQMSIDVQVISITGKTPLTGVYGTIIQPNSTLQKVLKRNRLNEITIVAIPNARIDETEDVQTFLTNTQHALYMVSEELRRNRTISKRKRYLPSNPATYSSWFIQQNLV